MKYIMRYVLIAILALVLGTISGSIVGICLTNSNGRPSQNSIALSLLQSLQSSAAIYVAQQRITPKSFSDFVVASGSGTGSKTLTLEYVRSELEGGRAEIKDPLVLKFTNGSTATYYLTGTDVTARFEGF